MNEILILLAGWAAVAGGCWIYRDGLDQRRRQKDVDRMVAECERKAEERDRLDDEARFAEAKRRWVQAEDARVKRWDAVMVERLIRECGGRVPSTTEGAE